MNLGAEPKKIAALGGLVLIGGYVFYANMPGGGDAQVSKTAAPAPAAVATAGRGPALRKASKDFKPTLKLRPEDRPNYATIDPTLRLDLLAKVQTVSPEGGSRSLFQFGAPPAPKPVEVAAIHPAPRMIGPEPPPKPAPPVVPPAPPPPPPITLKFYGFAKPKPDGQKRAFFMDGDEIFVAAEGELIKRRYRVVQIDVNSVVMEDTEYKNNRQTLILQQEFVG